jgi:hypothetical protein
MSDRTGLRAFEGELHRARGEMLLRRDPANSAPAEDAFLTAIAVARQQGTRSFELRAALALAKLYQSTARPADAHAVLAPALEGFAPTPEMPVIAKAQALLAALAETEEVRAAEARCRHRLHLQTAYGQAMMLSRGFGLRRINCCVYTRSGALRRARQRGREIRHLLRAIHQSAAARRNRIRARDRGSVPARSPKRGAFDGSGGRESLSGHGLPL